MGGEEAGFSPHVLHYGISYPEDLPFLIYDAADEVEAAAEVNRGSGGERPLVVIVV